MCIILSIYIYFNLMTKKIDHMEIENENKSCIIKHKEGSAELIPVFDVSKMIKKLYLILKKLLY